MRHPVCLSVAVVDVPGVLETQLSLWSGIFRCPVFESYQICHRKPSHSRSRRRHRARGVMEPPTTTNTQGQGRGRRTSDNCLHFNALSHCILSRSLP